MSDTIQVPREVAYCPCGASFQLEVIEWEAATGTPTDGGCYVGCEDDERHTPNLGTHHWIVDWATQNVRVDGDGKLELRSEA